MDVTETLTRGTSENSLLVHITLYVTLNFFDFVTLSMYSCDLVLNHFSIIVYRYNTQDKVAAIETPNSGNKKYKLIL